MVLMYLSEGIMILVRSIFSGTIIYSFILALLWITNKRREIEIKKFVSELILSIYTIAILKITGIIGMEFYLTDVMNGFYNINLMPFSDMTKGSILMIILNLLLFVPYGTLLSVVCEKQNWKKIITIGFITTLTIEALQLFGGRYAEIDDIIANTLGTFIGFGIYSKILSKKKKKIKLQL